MYKKIMSIIAPLITLTLGLNDLIYILNGYSFIDSFIKFIGFSNGLSSVPYAIKLCISIILIFIMLKYDYIFIRDKNKNYR